MKRTAAVDTSTLSREAADQLRTLVDAAAVTPGHTELPADPATRDAFGYQLELTGDDGVVRSLGFDYGSASPELKALVQAIRQIADQHR